MMNMESCLNMFSLFMKSGAKVILERYVKRFIGELSVDQISLSSKYFQHCCVKLKEVTFITDAINTEIETLNLPFEVVDCFAREINLEIDLTSTQDFICAKISGLILTLNMSNHYNINGDSLTASMASTGESGDFSSEVRDSEFVKLMTQLHKNICHKLTINIRNLKIRFQFISKVNNVGIAVEVNASELNFCNRYKNLEDEDMKIPLYDNKIVIFKDLEFYIEEFLILSNKQEHDVSQDQDAEVDHLLEYSKDVIPFCQVYGMQEFIFGYKIGDTFGPDIDLALILGSVHLFLSPKQIQQFITAFDIFNNEIKLKCDDKWKGTQVAMTESDYKKVDFEIKKYMEQNKDQESMDIKGSWSCQPDYDCLIDQNCKSKYSDINSSFYSVKSEMEENKSVYNKCVTHFSLNVGAINIVILYEDILIQNNDESAPFTRASVNDLQIKSKSFFSKVRMLKTKLDNLEDLSIIRMNLLDACPLNHFMLLVIPVNLNLQNNCDDTHFKNITELSIGYLDLYENLKSDEYVANIIQLCQIENFSKEFTTIPVLILQQSGSFNFTKQKHSYKNDISVTLRSCTLQIDITIIKRLTIFLDLFKKKSVQHESPMMYNDLNDTSIYMFTIKEEENFVPVNVSITSSKLTCILQFPVPDCTMKKSSIAPILRKEIVLISFEGVHCQTNYDATSNVSKFELVFDQVKGYFQEKQNHLKIPIFRLSKNSNNHITVNLEFHASSNNSLLNPADDNIRNNMQTVFMTKTVISQCLDEKSVKKELLLPGNVEYVHSFYDEAKRDTCINIKANIPYAQVSLPNKHTYEVLYNRFFLDIFVWFTEEFPLAFSDNINNPTNYNLHESINYGKKISSHVKDSDKPVLFSIEVCINEASASIRTPYKENAKVFVGKHGEIVFNISGGSLFLTNKCQEDNCITYLYIDVEKIFMLHQPNSNTTSTRALNEEFDVHGFDCILSPTELSFDLREAKKKPMGGCLQVSMEISYDLTRNVSSTVLACGLFGATLNFKMCPLESAWFNQLADVFQIEYSSISGYEHPCELTEINFYTTECLVSYSPLNLPLKSIFSIGKLWISLTSGYTSEKLTTHMFLEDSGVFLSKNLNSKISNLEYVCVIHLGYFELCHNGNNKNESEFSISNSSIHIRTCSDSCTALMELIIYISSGGDMIEETLDNKQCQVAGNIGYQSEEDAHIALTYMEEQLIDALEDLNPISTPNLARYLVKENNVKEMAFPQKQNTSPENNYYSSDLEDDDLEIIYGGDDEFCIIGSEIGTGITETFQSSELINLIAMEGVLKNSKQTVPNSNNTILKGLIKEMTIIWHIYGGNDFGDVPIHETVNADKPLLFSNLKKQDSLSNTSIDHSAKEKSISESKLPFCERGGKGRSHDRVMEIRLQRIRLELENFPKESKFSTAVDLLIRNVEIIDKIALSSINKFLYEDPQFNYPLCSKGYMMRVKCKSALGDTTPVVENSIAVSVRPLRVNVDQYALVHLSNFFNDLISNDSAEVGRVEQPSIPVKEKSALTIYVDGNPHVQQSNDFQSKSTDQLDSYIKEFEFHPALPIKVDYEGKGVVSSQYGSLAGLLIGLGRLNHSKIKLKSLHYHGMLDHNQLFNLMVNDWVDDIKQNQVGSIVGGFGPMKAFTELFNGIRDLIYMPIEQYKKDGRVLTGVKRGTMSFASSSAHATLDLAEKFIGCVQSLAEIMHDIVSQGPREKRRSHVMTAPPQDIKDGVNTAIGIISDGLGSTANTIYCAAVEEHYYKGVTGAVGGVIRQFPPAVMSPIILASEATCTVIGGVKSQLNPNERKEAMEKWKK